MAEKYVADIQPLNADKIGASSNGKAEFTVEENTLTIKIEMYDTPPNIQHWEHFHGFPDGKDASVVSPEDDVNNDGFLDLPETEPKSGTTMVPFDNAPHDMNIPHDNYPVADENGDYSYEQEVPLDELKASFNEAFGTEELELDKRVVYIHGVPSDLELPDTVGGEVHGYSPHTTLPIAVGKIEKV